MSTREAVPEVIRAQRFEAVREDGTVGAVLDSHGLLELYDAWGTYRAKLHVLRSGSLFLGLFDAAGKPSVGLIVDPDGPRLELYDTEKPRAVLCLLPNGSPTLALLDATGQSRAVVGCVITVDERTGSEVFYPESTVTLFNPDGSVVWQAP